MFCCHVFVEIGHLKKESDESRKDDVGIFQSMLSRFTNLFFFECSPAVRP